jgi:hypothetical protein
LGIIPLGLPNKWPLTFLCTIWVLVPDTKAMGWSYFLSWIFFLFGSTGIWTQGLGLGRRYTTNWANP